MEQHNLNVYLLGGFRITLSGETLTCLNQSRQQSLLAYLILRAGSPQSRQHIAFSFWPDSTEEHAYANLRYTLHHLRRSCPELERFLEITQSTLQWRQQSSFRLDVAEYETLITRANETADSAQICALLIQAASLYQGDLLPDCYDDWITPVRERLSQTHAQMLRQLVDRLAAQEKYQSAIDYATRLRSYDPFREMSYRRLMELHEVTGDRAAALRVYHDCVSVLERELGVEPSPETRTLYERIVNPAAPQATPAQPSPTVIARVAGEKLVGRSKEWRALQSAWQTARQGQPHLLLIRGEGGIGKTRLAEKLLIWANQRGHLTVRTRAYAAEGQLAYAPVIGWLRAELYRDKLRTLDSVWLVELARLLPELLSEIPDLPRLMPLTDSWQRQRLFEALAHAAFSMGLPLLVLMDDLQWADQETLEWLHFLLRFNPSAALLVVGTARMEEVDSAHPLSVLLMHLRHAGQVSEIELDALDAGASAELAQQVAGRPLEAEILAALYTYAEGVPLFLVEAVRVGADKGEEETWRWHNVRAAESTLLRAPVSIPPRVYAVLQARLAQLSPEARQLADLAAVIGRSFAFDLLALASGTGETELVRGLDELWKRRIVRERGADYDISHDRIRDVAYAELSPMQRRMLHRKVAQALEHMYAADLDAVSAQLAWHYEHAGLPKQAVDYYRRAGMAAQRVYAINQAIDLFSKGLALLAEMPDSLERNSLELSLQMAMAAAIRTKGYLLPEVIQALNRALELSRKLEDAKQHFWLLWGLNTYHNVRGEINRGLKLARQSIAIAEQEQNPLFLLLAHTMAGAACFHIGNQRAAQAHFVLCSNLYTPQMHEEQVLFVGIDYGVLSPAWSAHTLWCLGHANQALRNGQIALELAQQLAHPISQVLALDYLAIVHHFRRDRDAVQAQAEAALTLATQHEAGYYGAWAAILARWALAWKHPGPDEITGLRSALDDFRATGAGVRWPYYLSLVAEVYGKAGQPTAGLATVDEALSAAAAHGEHWWDAELHRLRGTLLLSQGADVQQVETAFQQALAIARQQQAAALELRAATSLARLWRQTHTDQARQMLSSVYRQFDEGFDTLDLQEAKALLVELS